MPKHQPYEYKLFCFLRKKHNNFNPSLFKIPKIFNFWSSERHQSLLGNGRVVTKINAVNFNLIISKKYGQSSH